MIVISGRNEKLPGHPLVYSTSKNFMDYFGINSASDLPKISEVLMEELVKATLVSEAEANEIPVEGAEANETAVDQAVLEADETQEEQLNTENENSTEEGEA